MEYDRDKVDDATLALLILGGPRVERLRLGRDGPPA